jgi:hypothetical protein
MCKSELIGVLHQMFDPLAKRLMSYLCSEGFAWKRRTGSRLGYGIMQELKVNYPSECQWVCRMNDACDSVNYRPADHTCQLIAQYDPSAVNYTDIVSDEDWEWWTNEFSTIV